MGLSTYQVWKSVNKLVGSHWEEYQEDVKKHGDYCASCEKRFKSHYQALVCDKCAESAVRRLDRRPTLKYKHYVYGLFECEEIVYVGVTKNPVSRLQSHLVNKQFDYMGLLKGFSTRQKAEEFELMTIELFLPVLNKKVLERTRPIPVQWRKELLKVCEHYTFRSAA